MVQNREAIRQLLAKGLSIRANTMDAPYNRAITMRIRMAARRFLFIFTSFYRSQAMGMVYSARDSQI